MFLSLNWGRRWFLASCSLVSAFTAHALETEPRLLRSAGVSAISDAAPGEAHRRCLLRLSRLGQSSDSAAQAACLSQLGSDSTVFQSLNGASPSSCTSGTAGNDFGILLSQEQAAGWWQSGPWSNSGSDPAVYYAVNRHLAITTPACAEARAARPNPCRSYWEVDVLFSGSPDFDDEIDSMASVHPWRSALSWNQHLRVIRVSRLEQIRSHLQNLLNSCRVVRNVMFLNHGLPGILGFGPNGDSMQIVSTADFLSQTNLRCALSPRARVQMPSCQQACREEIKPSVVINWGERIQRSLRENFDLPELAGVRFLFNTNNGTVIGESQRVYTFRYPSLNIEYPIFTLTDHAHLGAENPLAVEYSQRSGTFTADVDLASLPVCSSAPQSAAASTN